MALLSIYERRRASVEAHVEHLELQSIRIFKRHFGCDGFSKARRPIGESKWQ